MLLSRAQSVSVNNDGSAPDASAILDIQSTSKGILVPKMTKTHRDAIASPQNGLMIFQTVQLPGFYFNAGTTSLPGWKKVGDEVAYPSNTSSNSSYRIPGDYTFIVPDNIYKLFFEIAGAGGGYGGNYTPAVDNLNGAPVVLKKLNFRT